VRIDDTILKSVAFLGYPTAPYTDDISNDDLSALMHWCGTGFVVSLAASCGHLFFAYVVTAKHVSLQLEGRASFIRVNHTDGTTAFFKVPADAVWWKHPDKPNEVDVAILPWRIPLGVADVRSMEITEWFITDEILKKRSIGIGDDVFWVGLFSLMANQKKNWPIVRVGNIAMMPDEKIPSVNTGDWVGPIEGYLVEAKSFGGLSGSPVFVRPTFNMPFATNDGENTLMYGVGQPYLMGLVQGHWPIPLETINDSQIKAVSDRKQINLGFAIVVPARQILEVINQPELVKIRETQAQAALGDGTTVPDSEPSSP